jgi:hypothetical protein
LKYSRCNGYFLVFFTQVVFKDGVVFLFAPYGGVAPYPNNFLSLDGKKVVKPACQPSAGEPAGRERSRLKKFS